MVSTWEYGNCLRQKTQKKKENQVQRFTLVILALRRQTWENHELKDSLEDSRRHHQEYSKTAFLCSERMWSPATNGSKWILRQLFKLSLVHCHQSNLGSSLGLQGLGFLKLAFDSNLRPGRECMKEPRWSWPGLSYVCVMLVKHVDQECSCLVNQDYGREWPRKQTFLCIVEPSATSGMSPVGPSVLTLPLCL